MLPVLLLLLLSSDSVAEIQKPPQVPIVWRWILVMVIMLLVLVMQQEPFSRQPRLDRPDERR
jgi:hypothetical protein